ncbi:hypothetical protein [Nocardia transvalensis]|uniref:hypothetical protein n=1 Tax=Nocardia transvalensis TaxID=37333 RepID=UPI003A5CE990
MAELADAGFGITESPDGSRSRRSAGPTEPPHGPDADEAAVDLVRRKLRTLPRNLDPDKALRRLVGALARRGYSASTAYAIAKAELAAAHSEDDR